ncbi:hypothetical protein [Helicobacter sp. 11S02629-2]|nr:hypothetical protein [Helicobacter sp. 11S02629-2]
MIGLFRFHNMESILPPQASKKALSTPSATLAYNPDLESIF